MGNSVVTTDRLKDKTSGLSSSIGDMVFDDNGVLKSINGNEEVSVNKLNGQTLEEVRSGIDAEMLGGKTLNEVLNTDRFSRFTKLIDTSKCNVPSQWNVAINEDEEIVFWGYNLDGLFEYGMGTYGVCTIFNPNKTSKIKKVVASHFVLFVLYEDGKLYGMGRNSYGVLGIGNTASQFGLVLSNTNVTDISLYGVSHHTDSAYAMIIKNDNTVWGCGRNTSGNLGIGNTTDTSVWIASSIPSGMGNPIDILCVSAENSATYIVTDTGKVLATGYNGYGNLGDGSTVNKSSFIQITSLDPYFITSIVAGGGTYNASYGVSCAVLSNDGKVFTWGYNGDGQLGLGHITTPVNSPQRVTTIPLPYNAVSNKITQLVMTKGAWSGSLFLLSQNGDVFGTGNNQYGQMANGITTNISSFRHITNNVRMLVVSNLNSTTIYTSIIAVKNDNTLLVWGYNGQGQLGTNDVVNKLNGVVLRFEHSDKIVQISVGGTGSDANIVVLLDDGRMYGCGDNSYRTIAPLGIESDYVTRLVRINL